MERIFSNDRNHARTTPPDTNALQPACLRKKEIMPRINSIVIAILFSCLLPVSAWGQNAQALSGTVEDATGEYVVGAHVQLRNQITDRELSTNSEEEGQFKFDRVAFGD